MSCVSVASDTFVDDARAENRSPAEVPGLQCCSAARWRSRRGRQPSGPRGRTRRWDRRSGTRSRARARFRRRAGVPAAYVFTHNGWFHPSCVVRVQSDEVVGADLVVRGRSDGATHYAFAPCAYPRFDAARARDGRGLGGAAGPRGAAAGRGDLRRLHRLLRSTTAASPPGSTLVTEEIVPPPPTNVANQDIAFFNDILTTAGTAATSCSRCSTSTARRAASGRSRASTAASRATTCRRRPSSSRRATRSAAPSPAPAARTNGVCSAWSVTTADVTTRKVDDAEHDGAERRSQRRQPRLARDLRRHVVRHVPRGRRDDLHRQHAHRSRRQRADAEVPAASTSRGSTPRSRPTADTAARRRATTSR